MSDLNFLYEIRAKLQDAIKKNDPSLYKYVLKMINDWIDELEQLTHKE